MSFALAERKDIQMQCVNAYTKHRSLPGVGSFFAQQGKKEPTKEAKYHAAAGKNRFYVSPRNKGGKEWNQSNPSPQQSWRCRLKTSTRIKSSRPGISK